MEGTSSQNFLHTIELRDLPKNGIGKWVCVEFSSGVSKTGLRRVKWPGRQAPVLMQVRVAASHVSPAFLGDLK